MLYVYIYVRIVVTYMSITFIRKHVKNPRLDGIFPSNLRKKSKH